MKSIFYTLIIILSLSVNAQSWTLNYSTDTVSEQIVALSAPSDDICWFITNFDNLYKTINGGASWVKISPTATSFNPSALYVVDADVAFKSSTQQLFRTTNGGLVWSSVFTGSQFSPPVVQMKNATTGVLASGGILYKTTNGGVSWSSAAVTQPPLNIQNTAGKGNVFNLADELWVTQQNGGISYSPDFGNTWETPSNTGFTNIGTNARVEFADTNFGIAIKGSVWPYVYVTNDGGNNWVNTDDSQGANEDVVADQTDLWYIPNPADHFYIKNSTNGGNTWQIQLQLEGGHGFNVLEKSRTGHRLWAGTNKGKLYKYSPQLSLEDFTDSEVTIYPNPASAIIHFNANGLETINLYNMLGILVASKATNKIDDNFLDVSNLPGGIYIAKMASGLKKQKGVKLIIQN